MQEKPSDKWALPLCSRCHRVQHATNEIEFWTNTGVNPWVLAMTLHDITGNHELVDEVMARQGAR